MVHKALKKSGVCNGDHVVNMPMFPVMLMSVKAASLPPASTVTVAATAPCVRFWNSGVRERQAHKKLLIGKTFGLHSQDGAGGIRHDLLRRGADQQLPQPCFPSRAQHHHVRMRFFHLI